MFTLIRKKNINDMISSLKDANSVEKIKIENELVQIGLKAVPELVNQLQFVKGSIRGVVAMTLIRIGEPSIEFLKKAAKENKEFSWVADYLISEIVCKAA